MASDRTYNAQPVHDFPGGAANSTGCIQSDTASDVVGCRYYTGSGAVSGSSYCARYQHYILGASGSGAAVRSYALVKGVTALSLYGIEATAEIMSTASSAVTNELYAIKGLVDVNLTSATSITAALDLEIDVASGKTLTGTVAFIKCDMQGSGTQTPALLYLPDAIGDKSDTALVTTVHAGSTHTHSIQVNLAGTKAWIMCSTDNNSS